MTEDRNSDGFIATKTHRKTSKRRDAAATAATAMETTPTKSRDRNTGANSTANATTTNPTASVRFGGSKWAKPSAPTTGTVVVPEEAKVAPSLPSPSPPCQPQPQPQPQSQSQHQQQQEQQQEEEEESRQSVHLSSVFGIRGGTYDNNNNKTTGNSTTIEMWPGQHTQSFASLMEDYGTYDPNWRTMEPSIIDNDNDNGDVTDTGSHKEGAFRSIPMEVLNGHTSEDPNVPVDVDQPSEDTYEAAIELQPQPQQEEKDEDEHTDEIVLPDGINRLQLHGHAPIHVEFVSFGYRYGIPSEIRYYSTGNCYTQPLLPFDTRPALAPIPSYLSHIDGKAGIIKNTMLRWGSTSVQMSSDRYHPHSSSTPKRVVDDASKNCINVRAYVNDVVLPPVTDSIVDAIDVGQHGYVSPITISIYIGSEYGKHRSVVTAELSAVALRKLLRTNPRQRFRCPVSVGCRHRDIAMIKSATTNHKIATSKKQKALEENDE